MIRGGIEIKDSLRHMYNILTHNDKGKYIKIIALLMTLFNFLGVLVNLLTCALKFLSKVMVGFSLIPQVVLTKDTYLLSRIFVDFFINTLSMYSNMDKQMNLSILILSEFLFFCFLAIILRMILGKFVSFKTEIVVMSIILIIFNSLMFINFRFNIYMNGVLFSLIIIYVVSNKYNIDKVFKYLIAIFYIKDIIEEKGKNKTNKFKYFIALKILVYIFSCLLFTYSLSNFFDFISYQVSTLIFIVLLFLILLNSIENELGKMLLKAIFYTSVIIVVILENNKIKIDFISIFVYLTSILFAIDRLLELFKSFYKKLTNESNLFLFYEENNKDLLLDRRKDINKFVKLNFSEKN